MDSVPLPPAIGSRSSSGRRLGCVATGGGVDHPVERLGRQPVVDRQPAGVDSAAPAGVDACAVELAQHRLHGAVEALRPVLYGGDLTADRLGHHVVGLVHHLPQPFDQRRRLHRGDLLAGRATGAGSTVTVAGSTPTRTASARPASSAGVLDRHESTLTGWVRPPSSITDFHRRDVAAVDVGRIPARRHGRPAVGADVDLHRRHGRRRCVAHLVGQVADPRGVAVPGRPGRPAAADSVGSPPPLSTTTPGCPARRSPVVVSRASRSSVSSAAAVVSTLFVDAGCIGTSAPCVQSCAPVDRVGDPAGQRAKVRVGHERRQRRGQPVGRRLGCGVGDGQDAGLSGRRGRRRFDGLSVAGGSSPVVSTAATPTTAATSSSTATPITACVDRRHCVGRMTLLLC